jgi:carbon storage regulator
MLILTRKLEEEIVINSNIRIKILASSDGQVKLGIDAPKDVKIYRAELFDKIKMETEEAIHKSTETITDVSKLKVNKLKT